ncbi:MAG: hypothetical protein ACERIH_10475 [Labilibaculum antarcticum]
MNKIGNLIIIVFVILIIGGCVSTPKAIEINQQDTDLPVVLRLSIKHKKVRMINFPVKFKMINKSLQKRTYSTVEYCYNSSFGGVGIPLYEENGGKLIRISKSKWKEISSYDSIIYTCYTRHRVDSSRAIQSLLQPYIDKMLTSNQDSLLIGSLDEFKLTHPELLLSLLKNDSINVVFFNPSEDKPLNVDIKMPVKW